MHAGPLTQFKYLQIAVYNTKTHHAADQPVQGISSPVSQRVSRFGSVGWCAAAETAGRNWTWTGSVGYRTPQQNEIAGPQCKYLIVTIREKKKEGGMETKIRYFKIIFLTIRVLKQKVLTNCVGVMGSCECVTVPYAAGSETCSSMKQPNPDRLVVTLGIPITVHSPVRVHKSSEKYL